MITITYEGNGFKVLIKDYPGERAKRYHAANALGLVRVIEHTYGGAEQTNHTHARLDDCPLCRKMRKEMEHAAKSD